MKVRARQLSLWMWTLQSRLWSATRKGDTRRGDRKRELTESLAHSPTELPDPAPPSAVPALKMYWSRYNASIRCLSAVPGRPNSRASSMRSRMAASKSPGRLVASTTAKSRDWSPVRNKTALSAPLKPYKHWHRNESSNGRPVQHGLNSHGGCPQEVIKAAFLQVMS